VSADGGWGRFFPRPLVGVAVLIGLLILVTPFLTTHGQPSAGSIFSQAELIVDALPGNATMHFYVRGLGTTTRYDSISLGFAFGFNWTGGWPAGNLSWGNWTNGSNVLAVTGLTDRLPVALNVTALYVASGVGAVYAGEFALNITGGSTGPTLSVVSNTAGIGGFSTPVADLPIPITLALVSTGSVP
jgi:hypothetical protein